MKLFLSFITFTWPTLLMHILSFFISLVSVTSQTFSLPSSVFIPPFNITGRTSSLKILNFTLFLFLSHKTIHFPTISHNEYRFHVLAELWSRTFDSRNLLKIQANWVPPRGCLPARRVPRGPVSGRAHVSLALDTHGLPGAAVLP